MLLTHSSVTTERQQCSQPSRSRAAGVGERKGKAASAGACACDRGMDGLYVCTRCVGGVCACVWKGGGLGVGERGGMCLCVRGAEQTRQGRGEALWISSP